MTDNIDLAEINLATMTPAQLASIMSQLTAMEKAEEVKKHASAIRVAGELVNEFAIDTFASGAKGINLSGVKGDVTFPDGTKKNVTVSVLVRITATIPPRAKKGAAKSATDAAQSGSDADKDETKDTDPDQ